MFEPLVGELFRSGFVMQAAALQGDFVTPTLMGAGESDVAREQRGARRAVRHARRRRASTAAPTGQMMQGWLDEWAPRAASRRRRQLQPIWSQLSEKAVRFEDSLERALAALRRPAVRLGLETPKEA